MTPTEAPKKSLLARLKAGYKNTKMVNWPGTDEEIRITLPNEQVLLEASEAVDKIFETRRVGTHNVDDYEAEKLTQQLYRVIEDPATGKSLTSKITEFRWLLTPEVKVALADEFRQFADECDPNPSNLSDEAFDTLFEQVKKNSKTILGNVSSIFTARKLINALVEELSSLRTDSGSSS